MHTHSPQRKPLRHTQEVHKDTAFPPFLTEGGIAFFFVEAPAAPAFAGWSSKQKPAYDEPDTEYLHLILQTKRKKASSGPFFLRNSEFLLE